MYPYIEIFNKSIPSNYIFIFIGFLSMIVFNILVRKMFNYTIFGSIILSLIVNIFAILGAIILFNIESIGTQKFATLGLSFFGTVFLLPVFMFFMMIFLKKILVINIDHWAIAVPLELAFVRFGCYLSGCCNGIISDYGIQFPFDPIGIKRIPVQLIEVFFDLIIFAVLIIITNKLKIKKIVYPSFMIMYGMLRFVLEFFRDTTKLILGMSNGQLFSILSFLIGIIFVSKKLSVKNEF